MNKETKQMLFRKYRLDCRGFTYPKICTYMLYAGDPSNECDIENVENCPAIETFAAIEKERAKRDLETYISFDLLNPRGA